MFDRKTKNIELFGRSLVLAERYIIDELKLADKKVESDVEIVEYMACIVSDALKINCENTNGLKGRKLKSLLSPIGLTEQLSIKQLTELFETVFYELEGKDRMDKKKEATD